MLFMLKLSIYLLSRQLKIEKKLFIDKLFVVFNKHCTKNIFFAFSFENFRRFLSLFHEILFYIIEQSKIKFLLQLFKNNNDLNFVSFSYVF